MTSKLVYSTGSGDQRKQQSSRNESPQPTTKVKIRLETAGRGGKAVTVIFSYGWDPATAKSMLSAMQSAFGCGGAFKDDHLELRGDVRDKVTQWLSAKGIQVVRAGG
jgi:translation initiation factor 1